VEIEAGSERKVMGIENVGPDDGWEWVMQKLGWVF
jgi:hypothetical protein